MKILFVSNPMNVGGVEKSLLSVFNYLRNSGNDIFFMPYYDCNAKWNKYIPDHVHLLQPPEYLGMIQMYQDKVWKYVIKNIMNPLILLNYIGCIIKGLLNHNMTFARQEFWDKCHHMFPDIEEAYDIAVAWQGEMGSYFIVDKVNALRKISWYHGDYSNYERNKKLDEKYWGKLDLLVCVTEQGTRSLKKIFPMLSNKIKLCHNIVSKKMILELAGDYTVETDKRLKLLSVGRLNPVKGFDMAIEAAYLLKEKGMDFVWNIIGGGEMKKSYIREIEKLGLKENFFLIGELDNPYPYYKWCDIFVHTARVEGKPLVIDEAKIFCKPIVSTNFSTVCDQLENGVNGKVVEMNSYAIAEGIMSTDMEQRKYFVCNLEKEVSDDTDRLKEILEI